MSIPAYPVPEEFAAEQYERRGIGCADQTGEAERELAPEMVLMFELPRGGGREGEQEGPFERRQQPGRAGCKCFWQK